MSSSTQVTESAVSTEGVATERVMCSVKWFDSKKGWGFAQTLDTPHRDIFVHHKAIVVAKEQYRYLVQGEYVELDIVETDGGEHQYQAGNVSGIKGGPLMCETREVARAEQEARAASREDEEDDSRPQRSRSGRSGGRGGSRSQGGRGGRSGGRGYYRGSGPREGDEYILVRRN